MPKIELSDILLYGLVFFVLFFLSAIVFSQIILKSETVTVPELKGKTAAEARSELGRKDLALVQKGFQFSDEYRKGRIVLQDPVAGSKIQVNKPVKVIVSSGSETVTVPNFEGSSLETVSGLLREAGLAKGAVSQIHTPQYAAGKIIAQEPAVSRTVERGAAVGLLVSMGEREQRYLMPDLISKPAAAVVAALSKLDFKVGDIRYVYYPGLEPGLIIKQFPPNGYRVQKRNLIALEVSK
ncbi:MAG TPA: PASTA domain-containing protein [Candidatus Aminicenantes bacterium]|nr:PASTA domain-containing protein [Candidatus Aminicenantes bacterium]